MALSKRRASGRTPLSVRDDEWAEAVRREAVIRPLAGISRLTAAMVDDAAISLGLSDRRIYALLCDFRDDPVTASLLPRKPGRKAGSRRLASAIDTHIEAAIDQIYLARDRATLRKVLGEAARRCRAADLTPPSLKALRARISARNLRERVRAREGEAVAADRFRQIKGALRTVRPLQVVQIDHTKVDIMLVDDVTRACTGHPWLTLVLDVHTRMVVGLTLSLDPPSAAGAAIALIQAVLRKAEWLADRAIALPWPAQGMPDVIQAGTEVRYGFDG